MAQLYVGRISLIRWRAESAFIAIKSVTQMDGSDSDLVTTEAIYLRQEDCVCPLKVGTEVSFQIIPHPERGRHALRAVKATKFVGFEKKKISRLAKWKRSFLDLFSWRWNPPRI